jgi:hypothetical protein
MLSIVLQLEVVANTLNPTNKRNTLIIFQMQLCKIYGTVTVFGSENKFIAVKK